VSVSSGEMDVHGQEFAVVLRDTAKVSKGGECCTDQKAKLSSLLPFSPALGKMTTNTLVWVERQTRELSFEGHLVLDKKACQSINRATREMKHCMVLWFDSAEVESKASPCLSE